MTLGMPYMRMRGTANMSMSMLHIASSRARLAARSMGAASEGQSGVVSQRAILPGTAMYSLLRWTISLSSLRFMASENWEQASVTFLERRSTFFTSIWQ